MNYIIKHNNIYKLGIVNYSMERKEILLNLKNPNCKYNLETGKKRLIFWLDELKSLCNSCNSCYEEEKPFLKECKDNIDYFYYLVSEELLKMKLEKGD